MKTLGAFGHSKLEAASQQFWGEQTEARHRHTGDEWFRKYAEEMLAMLPRGGTLLDVGCGACQLTSFLACSFAHVFGVDISPSMLAEARNRLAALGIMNVTLLEGSAAPIPRQIPRVDVILAYSVLQYLGAESLDEHLQECDRVLSPGGVVCWGLIPNAWLRRLWYAGALTNPRPSVSQMIRRYASVEKRWWRARSRADFLWDGIGNWHVPGELRRKAEAAGFVVEFRNSWYYEYRFHALLRRKYPG